MKMKFRHTALALLCITGLSACGGGDGDGNSSGGATPAGGASVPATGGGTPPADTRNGTYQLYAVNSQQYQITVDFDKNTYTLSGSGVNVSGTLKNDDSTNTSYTFQGATVTGTTNNAHVQYTNDLLVGGFNFGTGVVPFVAGRKFVTDVSALNGKFTLFGVQTSTAGVAQSRVFAASVTAGTMKVCNDPQIYAIDSCPAPSVLSYTLTVNDGVFTAVSTAETTTFRAAQSGSDWIFLRSDPNATAGSAFRIGLPNSTGIANATFSGESNANEALTVTTATASGVQTYDSIAKESDGTTSTNHGTIVGIPNGPTGVGMTTVSTSSGPTSIFAMTGSNLGVFVGADAGPLAGYIVIGTHQ